MYSVRQNGINCGSGGVFTIKSMQFIFTTVISGILGILICQLILPVFVSNMSQAGAFETLEILDLTNIISWSAILITLVGLILTVILLSREYPLKPLLSVLGVSLLGTIFLLCMGSFLWLYIENPQIFLGSGLGLRILKFYSYPSLISLTLANPEPIWIISTILFIVIFNLAFFYVSKQE
jgi:hypothetical protein